jgi:hypothetical protein
VLAGDTVCVPLVDSVPVQPPLPTQDVAFLLDHLSVVVLPAGMVVALAVKETVGATGAGVAVRTVRSVDA